MHVSYYNVAHTHADNRSRCDDSQFTCTSGQCVPENNQCDNIIQCNDGSDENNCPGSSKQA